MTEAEPITVIQAQERVTQATVLVERIHDASTANQIKDEVLRALTDNPTPNLILDLGRVKFVSSVGFLAFMGIRRQAHLERVVLTHVDPNVREIFALCRLLPSEQYPSAPFDEAPTPADALALCR
jgi:anti-anti-sigma factor